MGTSAGPAELHRRLGVIDASVIGAGSMMGAGVFVVWAPAAAVAGTALLVSLVIAGVVAFCNASSSAQLAAVYPESGGTYVYAGRELGPGWGFAAGGSFVIGKLASCAAGALVVGAYLWPSEPRVVAVAAICLITAVNLGGLSRTVRVTLVVLTVTATALVVVVISGISARDTWDRGALSTDPLGASLAATPLPSLLEAAALLFFAFAGYARIATLGEEVRNPETTIPRAIPAALGAVLVVYAIVAVVTLAVLDVEELSGATAPLRLVVEAGGAPGLAPVVRIGAAVAAFGVLLNLVPGISRTILAMARARDLPGWWAAVSPNRSLPVRAEVTTAAVAVVLVLVTDVRGAIAASGVAVLWYYAITNAAALRLGPERRRWPAWIAMVGLIGCVVLAFSLEWRAIVTAAAALAVGVATRTLLQRQRRG